MSATDDELLTMARDLYKRLGGIGNKDARIVRGLWERWQAARQLGPDVSRPPRKKYAQMTKEEVIVECDRLRNICWDRRGQIQDLRDELEAVRKSGPDVSRLLAAAKWWRGLAEEFTPEHLVILSDRRRPHDAAIAEHEAARTVRKEQCTRCWEFVSEWVDPDWAEGRICLACESKSKHEAAQSARGATDRKRDELIGGCMAKARDNEMTFVLRGRDASAPVAIRFWIADRIKSGKNEPGDAKLVEAEECAQAMEDERLAAQPARIEPSTDSREER